MSYAALLWSGRAIFSTCMEKLSHLSPEFFAAMAEQGWQQSACHVRVNDPDARYLPDPSDSVSPLSRCCHAAVISVSDRWIQ
ncbi:MAG: hypothetical protein AUJ57_07900 [Zetaproteobacteria bacterium CG1_02_53_45]|nr:MAG: hypothetical protein AUJ57_07900 [Zetaproteobacteria bacterium CG1_02_53_45]